MSSRFLTVLIGCSAVVYGAWLACAVAAPDGASGAPHMQLTSESIVGVVLYPDGATPVPDLAVHVWNEAKQRFVYHTRTNNEGSFEIPWMREGRSFILVGTVKVDLQVMTPEAGTSGQRHDIIVVIPRKMPIDSSTPRAIHMIAWPLLTTAPLLPSLVSP